MIFKFVTKGILFFILFAILMAEGGCANGNIKSSSDIMLSRVRIDQSVFNLGDLSINELKSVNVCLQNIGNSPLIIYDVETDCSCTASEWPLKPILPKEFANIKIIFTGNGYGHFQKQVIIKLNTEEREHKIKLIGAVK